MCGSKTVALVGSDYIVSAEKTKPLLHVWPINSSEPSHDLRTVFPGLVGALAVSPNGKYIVAGIGEKIHLWQVIYPLYIMYRIFVVANFLMFEELILIPEY